MTKATRQTIRDIDPQHRAAPSEPQVENGASVLDKGRGDQPNDKP